MRCFPLGNAHAAQGLGEVCGTAIEAPMRFVYEVNVVKDKPYLVEPQYETDNVLRCDWDLRRPLTRLRRRPLGI